MPKLIAGRFSVAAIAVTLFAAPAAHGKYVVTNVVDSNMAGPSGTFPSLLLPAPLGVDEWLARRPYQAQLGSYSRPIP